jgi:hypothetical protein
MIRPLSSSDRNATAFPQHPTANLGLTRSACGTTMRLKWLLERGAILGLVLTEQPDKAHWTIALATKRMDKSTQPDNLVWSLARVGVGKG